MAAHTLTATQQICYETMVILGGGRWRGVQKGDDELKLPTLILFDDAALRINESSTMCLRPDDLSADRVRAAIEAKRLTYSLALLSRLAQRAA